MLCVFPATHCSFLGLGFPLSEMSSWSCYFQGPYRLTKAAQPRSLFSLEHSSQRVFPQGKCFRGETVSGMCSLWVTLGQFGGQELSETGKAKRKEESRQVGSGNPLLALFEAWEGPRCKELGSEPLTKATGAQGWLDLFGVFVYPAQPRNRLRGTTVELELGSIPRLSGNECRVKMSERPSSMHCVLS